MRGLRGNCRIDMILDDTDEGREERRKGGGGEEGDGRGFRNVYDVICIDKFEVFGWGLLMRKVCRVVH